MLGDANCSLSIPSLSHRARATHGIEGIRSRTYQSCAGRKSSMMSCLRGAWRSVDIRTGVPTDLPQREVLGYEQRRETLSEGVEGRNGRWSTNHGRSVRLAVRVKPVCRLRWGVLPCGIGTIRTKLTHPCWQGQTDGFHERSVRRG